MPSPSLAIILTIAAVIGSPVGGYVLLIARRDKPAEDAGNEIADGEGLSPTKIFSVHGKAD